MHSRFIPDGPTGTGRPRASRMHAVVRNEPDCPDGTESRALTSPRSTAKRIPWQVGDSYLQHDTLRFGLFSFSCPRIRYVRPTEAIAGPDCACDRAHGTHRYARSAPCFMPQGRAGGCKAVDRDRAPARNANVSKLKRPPDRRRAALPAGLPHRPGLASRRCSCAPPAVALQSPDSGGARMTGREPFGRLSAA